MGMLRTQGNERLNLSHCLGFSKGTFYTVFRDLCSSPRQEPEGRPLSGSSPCFLASCPRHRRALSSPWEPGLGGPAASFPLFLRLW